MLSPAVLRRALTMLGLSGCSSLLGIEDLELPDGPPGVIDGGDGGQVFTVECKAQRAVHLIGGQGGLAWFTLEWPVPAVITGFQATFAYDDPANAKNLAPGVTHPLFARRIGANGRALWEGLGAAPQPTVFVAGTNQTHTSFPNTSSGGGAEILAAGAVLQAEALNPAVAVVAFTRSSPYGPVPGAPQPLLVTNVDDAVNALQNMGAVNAAGANELRPSSAQLAAYIPPGSPQNLANMGEQLAFAANAFRLGVVGSVMIQAFNDDPHGAFDGGIATTRADQLATTLDAFYADLAAHQELDCGKNGGPLSQADNTVLLVTGDTYKNSFTRAGWPDGTPQNSNLVYMRSNGYVKQGWFGSINNPTSKTSWDPTTGDPDPAAPDQLPASVAATIYAISRGDTTAVARFTSAVYTGTIDTPP